MNEKDRYKNRIKLLQRTLDMRILQTLQWGHGYGGADCRSDSVGDVRQAGGE